MKRLLILFILLSAFEVKAQTVSAKNHHEIISILTHQQNSWNNGDIKGYMDGYWKSDSLKFITKTGISKGWNATLDMHKKHYPDKEAMGTLVFEEVDMIKMNATTIFVMGKWTLQKTKENVGGRFTLVCKKISGKWKIIIDHTS